MGHAPRGRREAGMYAPRGRIEADVRARERTRPAEGWTVWHIPALVWRTRPAEGRGHALHGTSPRWFGGPRVLPAFHARGARVSRSELNLTRAVCHACVREGVSEPNRVITVTDPCPPRRCVVGGWIRGMSPGVTRRQRISRRRRRRPDRGKQGGRQRLIHADLEPRSHARRCKPRDHVRAGRRHPATPHPTPKRRGRLRECDRSHKNEP